MNTMQRTNASIRTGSLLSHLLLLLSLLAGCQGSGRVHEVPPAWYPEGAPSPASVEPAPERDDGPASPEPYADARGRPNGSALDAEAAEAAEAGDTQRPDPAKAESLAAAPGAGASRPAPEQRGRRGRALSKRPAPEERPGLATHWGEARYSPARQVDFERADAERPAAVVELHYNDRAGARRMLPAAYAGSAEAGALGLRFQLLDARGQALPALVGGDHVIGIGAPGERYALSIENTTGSRYEVVASVDGLDVVDGEDASFEKRGYLVGPYGRVVIDGFRRSGAEVAAFRLGDVARSYAASKGKARNVGVIGIALFAERRPVFEPEPWRVPTRTDDTRLRQNAEPFPGRYARPPVW
jgi:hypothetical protein